MYASVGTEMPTGSDWTFEQKYDGMRIIAVATSRAVRLMTRPAPWHVVPKVRSMLPGWPTSTQLARPMSPGMMTGWPMAR